MKIKTTIKTDKFSDVPWPEGLPLPSPGDSAQLRHAGQVVSFIVDHRDFSVGADAQSGEAMANIVIHAHSQPAGTI